MCDNHAVSLHEGRSVAMAQRYQDPAPTMERLNMLTLNDLAAVFEDEAIFYMLGTCSSAWQFEQRGRAKYLFRVLEDNLEIL